MSNSRHISISVSGFILFLAMVSALSSQEQVKDTVHNLSFRGPGEATATKDEVCVFCHVPHSREQTTALWSHKLPSGEYKVRSSSPNETAAPQPDGVSLQCLGCHDGTIGLGELSRELIPVSGKNVDPSGRLLSESKGFLGTDLTGHHPVGVVVDETTVQKNNQAGKMPLRIPVSSELLDGQKKVQCTTCHDPHSDPNPQVAPFFKAGSFDEVCFQCHAP